MRYFLLPAVALCTASFAQTEVRQSSFTFSDGTHPTFVVTFDNADASQMESWYKGQLKDISDDIANKKETRASGVHIADISPDTITVLCKADRSKKSGVVSLHMAFRVNGEWLSTTSDKRMIEGAKNFCYAKAVAYKKVVLQQQLTEAERALARLQSEQATLEKDQRRYEEGIEKNKEKGLQAGKDKVQAEADLKTNEVAIDSKKSEIITAPSQENTEALQKLMRENEKLKDRIDRLGNQALDADKKVNELRESTRKNLTEQDNKHKAIEAQTKVVADLRAALASVN
jgi:hypothetical protein